ncbi:MAG: ABC transporter ATP-binding protein [Desulfurococcales archaeon]
MDHLVVLKNIVKEYGDRGKRVRVLDGINLEIRSEILAILGPSGCGKSTLLRIIAGIEKPSSGEIIYRTSNRDRPPIGFVFQSPSLLPWLTVLENVALPLRARGVPEKEAEETARKYLSLVGLQEFENFYPEELSGGMKQRVNLARALGIEPEILLMDEPFSHLDPLTAENLRAELLDIWLSSLAPVKAIVLVTHDVVEAVYMADRIAILTPRPARVASIINIDISRPRNRLSQEFTKIVDLVYEYVS